MKAFVPKRTTNFQQHQRRIERLLAEGMHDGKRWKDEAFARYNELEAQETAPIEQDEPSRGAPEAADYGNSQDRIAALKAEITRLKLQYTVAHCWWDDDTRRDSPEEHADECGLKLGDEFTLQASTYWDETFRVTVVPDASCDDYVCEQISEQREEFETYQAMEKERAEAKAGHVVLIEALRRLRTTLQTHWLSQIECNHHEKNDSAICACGWKSDRGFNVGKAVEFWIDHVWAEAAIKQAERT